jgi:cytoskeletal protein CcmA (bactofilin family)
MFSKPQTSPSTPPTPANTPTSETPPHVPTTASSAKKTPSLISSDLKLEGSITGGSEVQIDGSVTGDVRVERVSIGEGGQIDGGVFAEAVEVRGRVSGSITAKLVRLYSGAHVEGDITHEQLAIETGAFFQGRSLRLQRPAPPAQITPPKPALRPEPLELAGQRTAPAA